MCVIDGLVWWLIVGGRGRFVSECVEDAMNVNESFEKIWIYTEKLKKHAWINQ